MLPLEFNFWMEENPDFNQADEEQAIQRLFLRQDAVDEMLSGAITPDDFLDKIEGLDVNPDDYMSEISGQLLANGLWVP